MSAIKRTRNHVKVRLSLDQARAFARIMAGAPVATRQRNKLTELAYEAAKAAETDPPRKPSRTTFTQGYQGSSRHTEE